MTHLHSPAVPINTIDVDLRNQRPALRTEAVYVIFTTIEETLAAARVARDLAAAMGVPLVLLHFRTGRFTPPADSSLGISPVKTEALVTRLCAEDVDTRLRVYCCRNERQAIPYAFKPHSLIVVAGQRSWWPTRSERWQRALETAGHFVVFVDTSAERVRAVREAEPEWGPAATSWSR
jgi:hypothetical protein